MGLLFVHHGEDDFSRHEAIRQLVRSLGDPESAALNTSFFEADKARPVEVIGQASAAPFLGPKRLVVVNGVLSKFEPEDSAGGRPRRGRAAPQRRGGRNAKARQEPDRGLGGWESVVEAVSALPDSNALVFSDGKVSASNPLLRLLAPAAQVQRFEPLKVDGTARWVRERAGELGGGIEPDAAKTLAEAAPGDLWSLDAELAKLAAYAGDAPINSRHVAEVGSLARRDTIYALLDSVVAGQYGQARVRLRDVLDEPGMTTGRFIDQFGRLLRNLVIAKDIADHTPSKDVAGKVGAAIGNRVPYVIQKTVGQVRRFAMRQLIDMHACLLACDLGIKTGRFGEETALDLLLMELCAVASGRRAA